MRCLNAWWRGAPRVLSVSTSRRAAPFRGAVEFERSSLVERSNKLFTFSAIQTATDILLTDIAGRSQEDQIQVGVRFWEAVAAQMPEWTLVRERKLTAGEYRRDYVSAHGLALSALAHAGRALIANYPDDWAQRLAALGGLDWSRANTALWEGRAMVQGRISKAHANVNATAEVLKARLGLPVAAAGVTSSAPQKA